MTVRTNHDEEEERRLQHAEYVTQWEEENNARVLSRHGRSGRSQPAPKNNDVSAHIMEGEQEKSIPVQEVDNG